MIELFEFLRKHKVLTKYKKNFKKYDHYSSIKHFCSLEIKESNISGAFHWTNTIEGHEFWGNLDKKWRATL